MVQARSKTTQPVRSSPDLVAREVLVKLSTRSMKMSHKSNHLLLAKLEECVPPMAPLVVSFNVLFHLSRTFRPTGNPS
ncbi:hypothetical protein RRG08_014333 [Elysia crispata]|uniref:Uncharacterized protein n=1 Tax=Elysia crispata TaxID=231223 RepID=A0AAE0XPL4_9GAST|nr:hypothetical protein RRG08_014333 [Elysia crispata]